MIILHAGPEHDSALTEIEAHHWPRGTRPAPPPSGVSFLQRNPPRDTLVALGPGGAVLGYAVVGRRTGFESNAHVGWIRSLAVHSTSRRRGVGLALVRAAVDELRSRGFERAGLTVLSTNPAALRLYRKVGFVEEARLADQFRIDGRSADDVFMRLDLTGR